VRLGLPRSSPAWGFAHNFVQDNISYSRASGTLRGLHCQLPPHGQGKLVSVVTGSIWDFAVDVREGSPTFGQSVRVELDEGSPEQLWVPVGFLHGFITRAQDTRVAYKVTAAYNKSYDRSVAWNDPFLNLDWGTDEPILSDKDSNAPLLQQSDVRFTYEPQS
jgi:dTDP-4-dehydrorhamnose 3,5-epimerase